MFGSDRRSFTTATAAVAIAVAINCRTVLADPDWKGRGGTIANPKSGMWNVNANWDPAKVPVSANAQALSFSSGAGNPTYTADNNIAGTFDLHSLTLRNNSGKDVVDVIKGNPLSFHSVGFNAGRIVQRGANNFRIDNPIQPDTLLDLMGLGAGQVQLSGIISDPLGGKGRVSVSGAASYLLGGNNKYSGGTELGPGIFFGGSGTLLVGSDSALGSGRLTIDGGTIAAGPTQSRTIKNPVRIEKDFQAGIVGLTSTLTFAGTTTVSGVRTITTPSRDSGLILGGPVVATPTDGITTKGAGTLTFSGNSPDFRGALVVAQGTVKVRGTLGTTATPVASVTVKNGAELDGAGPGKIRLPKGTPVNADPGASVKGKGDSPGVLEIDGGGVNFAALSSFGWEFDGPTAGNGDGFHSLLEVPDSNVLLQKDAGQEPILEVDVLGVTSLPVVGQTYTVIDIDPDISRVIGDFMTPAGVDLPEGARFLDDEGFQWRISYEGGPNHNDVVLTNLSLGSIPEPGSLTVLASGLLAWWAAGARRFRGKQSADR